MKSEKKRLGEMLIEAGLIDQLQLNAALGYQKQWDGKLGTALINMGFVDERQIASVLEKQLGVKCISLENCDITTKALNAVKLDIAKKYCIMPLNFDKNTFTIAVSDPTDVKKLDDLSFMFGVRINPVLALESDIKNAIAEHYEGITLSRGKTFRVDSEKTAETMQIIPNETIAARDTLFDPEAMRFETTEIPSPLEKKNERKEAINALITLLIEKGIITREELLKKLSNER